MKTPNTKKPVVRTVKAWIALDKRGNPIVWESYGHKKHKQYEVGNTEQSVSFLKEEVDHDGGSVVPCEIVYKAPTRKQPTT